MMGTPRGGDLAPLAGELRLVRERLASLPASPPTSSDVSDTPPACALCGDFGWLKTDVPLGHRDFGKAAPCECKWAERLAAMKAGEWRRYAGASMAHVSADKRALVAHVMEAGHGGVYAHGSWGTGKTYFALAMTWALWPRLHGRVVRVRQLLNDIRSRFDHESGMTPDDFVVAYANWPMLVLDDLGAEYTTPWAVRVLFEIVELRCLQADSVLTVITTNFALDELADAYDKMAPKAGGSIASRIVEMCTMNGKRTVLHFVGPDRRLQP